MKSSPRASDWRRCRPALGTLVEVAVSRGTGEIAFAEIARIERCLSFHDPKSELSRLNRTPVGRWTKAGPDLAAVLRLALELQRDSKGRFNVAVGEALVAWRVLPGARARVSAAMWRALGREAFELSGARVRRLAPLRIDLGGIAKGYAVDRAVEALLERAPKLSGCVNAGGDLRIFGAKPQRVAIQTTGTAFRHRGAVATSAVARGDLAAPAAFVDIPGRRALRKPRTAVVRAERCALADAFTKIALLVPARELERLARRYRVKVDLFS